jgi:phosphoenolpyruvate carboxykinase (ATP)
MDAGAFDRLYDDFLLALADKDMLFVADLYGGSQPEHRVKVRVINELAWHNLFIRTLLVRPEVDELPGFNPEYLVIDLPSFRADPERHGCRSETVIAVNFSKKIILIGGTAYAGEMKKGVFGLLNFILPPQGIMPMHCSANIGPKAIRRSSSACRAPARQRCRPIRTGRSLATTSMVGRTPLSSISKAAATR